MAQIPSHSKTTSGDLNASWQTLYKVGAIVPLIVLAFYFVQIVLLIFGEPFPTTVESWYLLIQRNRFLGFLYLNGLDVFSITVLGIMFLALYIALRKYNQSLMIIAVYLAIVGVVVFVVPRVAMLSVFPLSDQFAAAATDGQRASLLTAGETLNALGTATPQTLGFFFLATAGLLISWVILKSGINKVTAYLGIIAFCVTVANQLSLILAPALAAGLMPLNGLLWLIWWLMMSRLLLQISRKMTDG